MTLLDADALVAFLAGGPAATQVRGSSAKATLRSPPRRTWPRPWMSSAGRSGLPVDRAMEVLEPLLYGTLGTVSLDLDRARLATIIRDRHYHRASRPISLADAIVIASAGPGDRIATADPDVLVVAQVEAIATITLRSQD